MNERERRAKSSNSEYSGKESFAHSSNYSYDDTPEYADANSRLPVEELDADDERIFNLLNSDRATDSNDGSEPDVPIVDKSALLDKAGELGLVYEELGQSVQDLSTRLSDLSNPTSESTAWWQSLLAHVPYLGGLVEPDSGRMLLNLGEEGYALLRGDLQSIYDYMALISKYSANTALFWKFPLLFGIEPGVVREAETIMIGTRSSDLLDFLDAARKGSVEINSLEQEAVPLLNWMALQAGEQSTDIEENENASDSALVFAAAISRDIIFVDSMNDGTADRLVARIESIYSLAETAPMSEQRNIIEMLNDELLNIINDDNRWGLTDNDLGRMVDNIERLEQEYQKKIEGMLRQESEASPTGEN